MNISEIIQKLRAEPVLAVFLLVAIVVAALIQGEVITIEQVNDFLATVVVVFGLLASGFGLRRLVSPATGDAAANRENAIVAETLGRVGSGDIDPVVIDGGE